MICICISLTPIDLKVGLDSRLLTYHFGIEAQRKGNIEWSRSWSSKGVKVSLLGRLRGGGYATQTAGAHAAAAGDMTDVADALHASTVLLVQQMRVQAIGIEQPAAGNTTPNRRSTHPMTRRTIVNRAGTQHWRRRRCCRRWRQEMMCRMMMELMGTAYGSVYSSATALAAAVRWRWGGGVTEGAAIAGPMGFAVEAKGF